MKKDEEAMLIKFIEDKGVGKFTSDSIEGEIELINEKKSKLSAKQRVAVMAMRHSPTNANAEG